MTKVSEYQSGICTTLEAVNLDFISKSVLLRGSNLRVVFFPKAEPSVGLV